MKKSKLNNWLKKELLLAHKKMSPKERLNAFLEHSRLLIYMFRAGENYRKKHSKSRRRNQSTTIPAISKKYYN